jgi:RNA polymerase-binding protein DksA
MNKTNKIKIKNILLKKREEVIKKVKHIEKENLGKSQRDASGDLSGYRLHMADVASDNFEREISLGLAASEQDLLCQIDDAINRIKEKNFGICQICSKEIGMKRLLAVPYAVLCIACKEREEKKGKK